MWRKRKGFAGQVGIPVVLGGMLAFHQARDDLTDPDVKAQLGFLYLRCRSANCSAHHGMLRELFFGRFARVLFLGGLAHGAAAWINEGAVS